MRVFASIAVCITILLVTAADIQAGQMPSASSPYCHSLFHLSVTRIFVHHGSF